MAGQQEVSGFDVGVTYIPAGVSLAVLITDPPYTAGGLIQYVSGGSLLLMKAPGTGGVGNFGYGATFTGATLVNDYNLGRYAVIGNAPLAYDGASRYYLAAVGATAMVQWIRGLSPGYTEPNPS